MIKETCKFLNSPYDAGMVDLEASASTRKAAIKTNPAQGELGGATRLLQLLGAAESIFLAKGYHAATMSDVAKAAGISKKTIYMLVKSKSDLFAELLLHYQSLLKFPEPEPGWSMREVLVANLLCQAHFLLSPGQIAILRLIMAEYTHCPDLGRIFHRSRVIKAKSRLESCLLAYVKLAEHPNFEVKEMASMLFGMAIGEFHLGVLIGFYSAPSKQALEKRISRAVDIFLAGCGCGEASPIPRLPTCGAPPPGGSARGL